MQKIQEHKQIEVVKIMAQEHLQQYYNRFGFKTVSEPFDDAGIMHVDMVFQVERSV